MIVDTAAGPVELDEADIPRQLRASARSWFARETARLAASHGSHWPAVKGWLCGYLRAELRDLVEKGVAPPGHGEAVE
jgi:hypothetical protein